MIEIKLSNDCEFCEDYKNGWDSNDKMQIGIRYDAHEEIKVFEMNYCPVCGRKLNDK